MPSFTAGMNAILTAAATSAQFIQPPPFDETQQLPGFIIQTIDGQELESLEGLSELSRTVMQISVYNKLYDNGFNQRASIVAFLRSFSGDSGVAGLKVDCIHDFRYRELYMPTSEIWQLILRCVVWWTP